VSTVKVPILTPQADRQTMKNPLLVNNAQNPNSGTARV
jgi:hypothetical protein